MTKEIELPSGRKIEITPAPFSEAKRLYQSLASEFMRLDIRETDEMGNLIKNVLCLGISSAVVDSALSPCIKRCTYEGRKIVEDTFEPVEAREDYLDVCYEIAKENVQPFMKSLFAQFRVISGTLESIQQSSALKAKTAT